MAEKKIKLLRKPINWWFVSAVSILVLPLIIKLFNIYNKNYNLHNQLAGFTTITRVIASLFIFIGLIKIYKNWYKNQLIKNIDKKEDLAYLSVFELKLLIMALFENDGFKVKLTIFDKNNKFCFVAIKNKELFFIDASNWNSDVTRETIERTKNLFNLKKVKGCYLLTIRKITKESYVMSQESSIEIFNLDKIFLLIKKFKEE